MKLKISSLEKKCVCGILNSWYKKQITKMAGLIYLVGYEASGNAF